MTQKIVIKKFNSKTQQYEVLTFHPQAHELKDGWISFKDPYNPKEKLTYPADAVIEIKEVL